MATLSKNQQAQRYREYKELVDKYREFHDNELGERPEFDAAPGAPEVFSDRSTNYGIRNGELEARLPEIAPENLDDFAEGEERVTALELIDGWR